jgi:hypothetical protein
MDIRPHPRSARRGRVNAPKMRVDACKWCGGQLDRSRPWQEFCRDQCRFDFHNAQRRTKSPPTAAAEAVGEKRGQKITSAPTLSRRPTKLKRVLAALARGQSLNRFDAERIGDHCLHSTIAKIEAHDIKVARRDEAISGYGGHKTKVCRYWLDDVNREHACKLLGWEA